MTNHRLAAGALLAATALTFAAPASAQRVDRIVAFGDSYADDGNFFQIIGGTPPALAQVFPTGRFSGGTRAVGTQRLRGRPRPRAFLAVAVPAAGHPHRPLPGLAALAQHGCAARAVAGIGSLAADR